MTVVELPTVRQAVVELARDGTDELTSEDVAAHIGRSPLPWVHSSIGNQLDRIRRTDAIEKVAPDSVRWRIVDADVLDDPEIRADGGRVEPEFLDVVAAPGDRQCMMWGSADEPERCSDDAEYLVVYDGSTAPDETVPRNVFACDECFTPPEGLEPEVATDGGIDTCEVCGGAVRGPIETTTEGRLVCADCSVDVEEETLATLREGIASAVAADDDRRRQFGEFVFERDADWSDAPGSHVVVDAADGDYPNWAIVPVGLADLYLNQLEGRLDEDGREPVRLAGGDD